VKLYDYIALVQKWHQPPPTVEEDQAARQREKTQTALNVSQHLAQSAPPEPKPVQLQGWPVPN
jgi:hypothetical protein